MSLHDKKIIKLEPIIDYFTVNWNIGIRCNFDCMYCPEMYHNKTDTDLTLAELQDRWQMIVNNANHKQLKYKVTFTGGEVTINKDFILFLQWLDENYKEQIIECGFTSNGSASKQYYLDALELPVISFISLSTHSEFFNESKFFNTAIALNKQAQVLKKSFHVNVMDEYWNQDRIKLYCEFLTKEKIKYSVNKIYYSYQIRGTPVVNKNTRKYKFE